MLAVINFQDATRRAAGGSSSSFHPKWFKGNGGFFWGGNPKSRIFEKERYFETKIKRKKFLYGTMQRRGHRQDKNCRPNPRKKKKRWLVLKSKSGTYERTKTAVVCLGFVRGGYKQRVNYAVIEKLFLGVVDYCGTCLVSNTFA